MPEKEFWDGYGIDPEEMAQFFVERSPYRHKFRRSA
jgi:hypothetical protein